MNSIRANLKPGQQQFTSGDLCNRAVWLRSCHLCSDDAYAIFVVHMLDIDAVFVLLAVQQTSVKKTFKARARHMSVQGGTSGVPQVGVQALSCQGWCWCLCYPVQQKKCHQPSASLFVVVYQDSWADQLSSPHIVRQDSKRQLQPCLDIGHINTFRPCGLQQASPLAGLEREHIRHIASGSKFDHLTGVTSAITYSWSHI